MLSKMSHRAAAAAMAISVLPNSAEAKIDPPPQYTYLSTLTCAECIQAGYTYVYDAGTAANTQLYNVIDNKTTATLDYSGFCCELGTDGKTFDCNDSKVWTYWKNLISGEEYGVLQASLNAYNTKFGTKTTKALVSTFQKEMTNTDAKNWVLAKSVMLNIDASKATWQTTYVDTVTTNSDFSADKTLMTTYISKLDTLETQYGYFAKYIFAQKLVNAISVYAANTATQNLKTLFDSEYSALNTFIDLMTEVSVTTGTNAVTNSATYVQELKDIFTLLYKSIKDADSSVTTYTTNETTTKAALASIVTSNVYTTIADTKTTLTASLATLTAASTSRFEPAYKLELAAGLSHPTVTNIITAITNDKGTKKSSELFTNKDLAIAACPNLNKVCSTRLIELAKVGDSGTFTVTNPTKDDACSVMVKTTCGYPDINIGTVTLTTKWALTLFEWQDGSKVAPGLQGKTEGNELYPAFTADPKWVGSWTAGEAGFVPFYGSTVTVKNFQGSGITFNFPKRVPISKVINMVDKYKARLAKYDLKVKDYNLLADAYDAANKLVKGQIKTAQETQKARGFFDCVFGCEAVAINIAPTPPKKPLLPKAYSYFTLDKLQIKKGKGNFGSGKIDLATGIKSFGVFGSSAAGKLGYSQTLDTSKTELKDGKNVTTDTCKTKYSLLSFYPELGNTATAAVASGTLSITVKSENATKFNTTPPAMPPKVRLVTRPVNQKAIDNLLAEINGAYMVNIAATVAVATYAGMTLF